MILANPPAYLTAAQFRAQANDYDLTPYTDAQLQDMLNRASGACDSFMRKSYLLTERDLIIPGSGGMQLDLGVRPLAYIKKAQFLQPGSAGFVIPIENLVVDYDRGQLTIYTPLALQGIGIVSLFPRDFPIQVRTGIGYGFTATAPTVALTDSFGGSLASGSYDVAVTSKTPWGETTATLQTVVVTKGAISVAITPSLGASSYRVFAAAHAATPLMFNAEAPATTYGVATITTTISSLTTPVDQFPESLPTTDTSAMQTPFAFTEAVRLMTLSMLYEQNNLSNRGVYKTDSGRKSIMWRSTEGMSGKGIPLLVAQAQEYLKPYALQAVF